MTSHRPILGRACQSAPYGIRRRRRARIGATSNMASDNFQVLLGVMANPVAPMLRSQWREWTSLFKGHQGAVTVKFIFGKSTYQHGSDPGPPTDISDNRGDHLVVDGREKLPKSGTGLELRMCNSPLLPVRLLAH